MKKVYVLFLMIFGSVGVWGQQVIGSFPTMNGGFEGQTAGALATTLSPTNWTRQSQTGASSSIVNNSAQSRSGNQYVTVTNVATASRAAQSPQAATAANGPAASTAYVVQFYVKNASSVNGFQGGVTINGTTNPTYSTAALLSANATWTKQTFLLTTSGVAHTTAGIGIVRSQAGVFDVDDFVIYAGVVDNTAANSPGTVTVNNPTSSTLDVSWLASIGGVDGGGYVVVRYAALPGATDDPLQNGIYAVSNTVTGGVNGTVAYIGTGLSFTDAGLAAGTTYYYKVYTVDKAFNYSGESEGNGATTAVTTPDIALSSPTPAVPAGNILQGSTNNPIYRFDLAVTTANATLNGVTINTAGTYAATDITNFKCWYSADNIFSAGTDVLLSTKTTSLGAGTHVFPSFTAQIISNGSTGYIFITADLPCAAVVGNNISVNAITTADISFVSGNKSGSASAGGLQTITAASPNNVTAPAASVANSSSTLTWTNPTGCYDEVLIVARSASPNDGVPTGDGSAYTGNLNFGSGTALGSGFVVYKGTASPQTVTGLTNGTVYYYKFFTRFGTTWSAGAEVNATPGVVTVATDYFRSKITGDWNLTTTWESSSDNATWMDATLAPDNNANTITIRNTHVVTVALPVTADQVVVEPTATLALAAIFTVADGAGADVSVDGTVINALLAGNHVVTGTIVFNAGSLYQHVRDGGIVLQSTWATTSTVEITGIITSTTLNCGNQTFGNFTWNNIAQTVNLNLTGTLATINGNFRVQNTGPTGSLRMTGTANLNLVVGGNYTIEANHNLDNSATGTTTVSIGGNFAHTGGIFESSAAVVPITMTGVGRTFTQSGGTFNNANLNWIVNVGAEITLNSNLPLATSRTLTIDGILNCGLFAVNSTGAITVNNGGRARVGSLNASGAVEDNLTASGGLTLNTGSTIEFNGLAAQFVGARTFSNLEFNNASGATLIGAVLVNNILGLTSGRVTTSATNLLTMGAASSVSGASNASFVFGPVKKIGNTIFTFPVGKTNGYVPIRVSNFAGASAPTDEFTAEYIRASGAALGGITAPLITKVSSCEYWKLDVNNGTPTADITLYWNTNNPCGGPYITNLADLEMAHFNGTSWDASSNGFSAKNGNTTAGDITWSGVSIFSPFTLASSTGLNPLPITINYFNGTKQNGSHLLNWKVTCVSTPNATIEMQRSINGSNYSTIYSIVATALRCQQPFDHTDSQPAKGTNYYRLKMTDADGKVTYSSIVSLINATTGIEIMTIAPNPLVNAAFNLKVSAAKKTQMELVITDMQGRILQKLRVNTIAGFNVIPVNVRNLSAGTYQLVCNTAEGRAGVLRFVIQ